MAAYYLEGLPYMRPAGLAAYLGQYAITARVRCHDITAGGGGAGGWVYPYFTCLGLAGGAAVGGVAGAAAGGGLGLMADLIAGQGRAEADDPPADPVVASVAEIDFVDVSPKRAKWAEYLLCGWARAAGWSVRRDGGRLLYARNETAPARPPRPWSAAKTAGAVSLAIGDLLFGDDRRRPDRPARRRRDRG